MADLVLIDGDPSVNIADLRRASLVIESRVAYAPDKLYETMGYKPFVPGAAWHRGSADVTGTGSCNVEWLRQ